MKKLNLDLNDLAVESFPTHGAPAPGGTVQGFGTYIGYTCPCDTVNATCDGGGTCGGEYTCNMANPSCVPSCTACNTNRCAGGTGLNCQSNEFPCESGVATGGCTGC